MADEIEVPAFYPDFKDANKVRRWDGSQEANAWGALWHYRRAAVAETVEMMIKVGGEDADLVGLTALLWDMDEDIARELLNELGEKGRELGEAEAGNVRKIRE